MDTSSCLAAALRKTEFITLLATNLVTLCKPASVVGLLNTRSGLAPALVVTKSRTVTGMILFTHV
jgi:hypothetical protein